MQLSDVDAIAAKYVDDCVKYGVSLEKILKIGLDNMEVSYLCRQCTTPEDTELVVKAVYQLIKRRLKK